MKNLIYLIFLITVFVSSVSCEKKTRKIGDVWWDEYNQNRYEQKDGFIEKNCGWNEEEIQIVRRRGYTRMGTIEYMCDQTYENYIYEEDK